MPVDRIGAYGLGMTPEDRQRIREHNLPIIKNAFASVPKEIQIANEQAEYSFFLPQLIYNRKVDSQVVNASSMPLLLVAFGQRVLRASIIEAQQILANYKIEAHVKTDQTEMGSLKFANVLQLGDPFTYLNVQTGYEGNGFGQGLIAGLESLVSRWLKALGPENYEAIIAIQVTDSRFVSATAEERGKDDRSSWSPVMLASLGYANDPELDRKYVPEYYRMAFGLFRRYLKIWQDTKSGIDLLDK